MKPYEGDRRTRYTALESLNRTVTKTTAGGRSHKHGRDPIGNGDLLPSGFVLRARSRIIVPERKAIMEGLLQPTHLMLILGIALLIFGPKKLPELGQGLGKGIRGFRDALKGIDADATGQRPTEPRT